MAAHDVDLDPASPPRLGLADLLAEA